MTQHMPQLFVVALALLFVGCGHPELSDDAQALLQQRVDAATSAPVYVGDVRDVARPDDGTLFWYERRVDDGAISHLTRTTDGMPVVWIAVGTDDEAIRTVEEVHVRRGLVAHADVDDDRVLLRLQQGEGVQEELELAYTPPLVTGPTLFNHLLRHRDDLAAGVEFDFLSVENRGVFRFAANAAGDAGTFEVVPVDPLVRLVVPPLRVVYDDDTQQMVSYQGPVPPLRDDGSTFEGDVSYSAAQPFR